MKKKILVSTVAAAALLQIHSAPSLAAVTTIDFEALTNLSDATAYLTGFGVTTVAEAGTSLCAFSENYTYGGGVVGAPSGIMYITQAASGCGGGAASPPPNTFTLNFNTPLDSFGFSESAMLLPSITASWTATAYSGANGTGTALASASYSHQATHPVYNYTLNGPSIASVVFNQNASLNAAFYSGNFDNFVLTTSAVPIPAAVWLFGSGILGLAGVARRKKA